MDMDSEDENVPLVEVVASRKAKKKGKRLASESSSHTDTQTIVGEVLQQMVAGFVQAGLQKEKEKERKKKEKGESQDVRDNEAYKEFSIHNPPEFWGLNDPQAAHLWLDSMERIWRLVRYDEFTKVRLATHKLRGRAESWWKQKLAHQDDELDWKQFRKIFEEKYYPSSYRDRKVNEFMHLVQGAMTVTEYADKYTELAEFAPYIIPDAKSSAKKFVAGIRPSIHRFMGHNQYSTFEDAFDAAIKVEIDENLKKEHFQQSATSRGKRGEKFGFSQHSSNLSGSSAKRLYSQQQSSGRVSQFRPPIVQHTGGQPKCDKCGRFHPTYECRWITGGCFKCGAMDHRIKNCPELYLPSIPTGSARPPIIRPPQQSATKSGGSSSGQKFQPRARLYSLTSGDAKASDAVVAGESEPVEQEDN